GTSCAQPLSNNLTVRRTERLQNKCSAGAQTGTTAGDCTRGAGRSYAGGKKEWGDFGPPRPREGGGPDRLPREADKAEGASLAGTGSGPRRAVPVRQFGR